MVSAHIAELEGAMECAHACWFYAVFLEKESCLLCTISQDCLAFCLICFVPYAINHLTPLLSGTGNDYSQCVSEGGAVNCAKCDLRGGGLPCSKVACSRFAEGKETHVRKDKNKNCAVGCMRDQGMAFFIKTVDKINDIDERAARRSAKGLTTGKSSKGKMMQDVGEGQTRKSHQNPETTSTGRNLGLQRMLMGDCVGFAHPNFQTRILYHAAALGKGVQFNIEMGRSAQVYTLAEIGHPDGASLDIAMVSCRDVCFAEYTFCDPK